MVNRSQPMRREKKSYAHTVRKSKQGIIPKEKLQVQCAEYVKNTLVSLADRPGFELLPWDVPFPRKADSRRDNSMNLNANLECLQKVHHIPTGSVVVFCYGARLQRVRRPLGKLKEVLPGFKPIKMTSDYHMTHEALAPFASYLPGFVADHTDKNVIKSNKETFASVFHIFFRDGRPAEEKKADSAEYSLSPASFSDPSSPESFTSLEDSLDPPSSPANFQDSPMLSPPLSSDEFLEGGLYLPETLSYHPCFNFDLHMDPLTPLALD